MIIIINGSVGVGKSTVAEQLHWKFDKSVHLDGDHIGNVHPFEIYDDARVDHLYRTLALLIGFHQKNGYQNFVINYVFESPGSLQDLLNLLRPLDASIRTYWLTCEEQEHANRIRGRQSDDHDWELSRFVKLHRIQREAASQGFIGIEVDTTHLTSAEVAEKIWLDIFDQQTEVQEMVSTKYAAIVALLTTHGIPFTIHEHAPSYTVADAKERLLFPLERLLKTIAFRVKAGSYVLAAARGPDRIDYRKLAAACLTKRTEVIRLTPQEVVEVFGVEVGSVSPIVLQEGVQVFFDTHVPTDETVFCGIGRPDRTLEIGLMDLVQITQGQILPLVSDET